MEITPQALEQEFSLQTAATRLDFLSRRDSGATTLNTVRDTAADDWSSLLDDDTSLDVPESLELLALGEVIARKAHDSQLTGFRAALRGGATWEQIAAALDTTPAEAWSRFQEAIEQQERSAALAPDEAASARELAGARPTG
ncbi:hypothetical protein SAMN05660690_2448 [Geodermatophilus telluris]|uniref:Uncharacterized protein n=1 Tax=Geodermatophilus telluris TaxID=1190417 RepID=A0A1G6PA04_9ACTN|nr:hypothetical protein [Geodermatophilus telluris]SDC76257.1 hypothetical protein SAMN05660690_2448 [Geodermatophilus telluris]